MWTRVRFLGQQIQKTTQLFQNFQNETQTFQQISKTSTILQTLTKQNQKNEIFLETFQQNA